MTQASLRSIAIRSLEAAGLVVYAYLIGGLITEIRLLVAGLPSGAQMLTTVPNAQLVATGAKAMITLGAGAIGLLLFFYVVSLAGDACAKVIVRLLPRNRHLGPLGGTGSGTACSPVSEKLPHAEVFAEAVTRAVSA